MKINLYEIFETVLGKNIFVLPLNIHPMSHIVHKLTQCFQFSTKMTYLDKIESITDSFDQSYVNNPDLNNF